MNILNNFWSIEDSKRKMLIFTGIFFAVCTGLGVFFHFAYEILGEAKLAAALFPVNESIWEHLKLIFVPYVLLLPAEYFLYGKRSLKFITGKTVGVLLGMLTVIVLYYTISGVFGEPAGAVNIAIYVIATLVAYAYPACNTLKAKEDSAIGAKCASLFILATVAMFFIAFTFYPPELPIFLAPDGKGYGYYKFQ